MLTGTLPGTGWLVAWLAVVAALGVFAAIPIKRQLINIEALPFPTGTATAETINALHGHGEAGPPEGAAARQARGSIGAIVAVLREAKSAWLDAHAPALLRLPLIPAKVSVPFISIAGARRGLGAVLRSAACCWWAPARS